MTDEEVKAIKRLRAVVVCDDCQARTILDLPAVFTAAFCEKCAKKIVRAVNRDLQ